MKKYIGTKQVEAEPMAMGEAYEKDCCKLAGSHQRLKRIRMAIM